MQLTRLLIVLSGRLALAAACGFPPIVDNATVTVNNRVLTFACLNGYKFSDGSNIKNVTCSGNPTTWSPIDGRCTVQSRCSNLTSSLTPAMSIDSTDTYTGAIVNVRCNTGTLYKANGLSVQPFKCMSSGFWDRMVLPCSNVTCPVFAVQGAIQNISDGSGNYGSVSTWTCDFGTSFPGGLKNMSATCSVTGVWSVLPPLSGCQAGLCIPGWTSYNSRCYAVSDQATGQLRRDVAAASCRTKGGQLATINDGAENAFLTEITGLTSAMTPAEAIVGYWIGARRTGGDGAWLSADSDGSAVNVTYTNWMLGYPEGLGDCAQLTFEGLWKDKPCESLEPYICERPQVCGTPPAIQNGAALLASNGTLTMASNGLTLTYMCNRGYWFSNGLTSASVTCSGSGSWTYAESCQAVYCPSIIVKRGYISRRSVNTDIANATLVINCKDGFTTPSGQTSLTVTCQEDGTWKPAIFEECVPASCSLPAVPNAVASLNASRAGVMDVYTCQQGYQLEDSGTQVSVTCMPDGTWYPNTTGCQRQACPPFVALNATMSRTSAFYQDRVLVTCLTGYRLAPGVTSGTVACLAGGTWSSEALTCQRYYCADPPPDVANANKSTNESAAGTQVNYTCTDGYQLSSPDQQPLSAVCDLVQVTWVFQQNSACTPIPGNDTTPVNALVEFYGSVSVATLVLLLSIVALVSSATEPVVSSSEGELKIMESHQLAVFSSNSKDLDKDTSVASVHT